MYEVQFELVNTNCCTEMSRTQEEIDREAAVDLSNLRDPQSDSERVQKPVRTIPFTFKYNMI